MTDKTLSDAEIDDLCVRMITGDGYTDAEIQKLRAQAKERNDLAEELAEKYDAIADLRRERNALAAEVKRLDSALFIETESCKLLGRVVNDKDADRIFYGNYIL